MPPHDMAYISMYLTAREVFGDEADADFIISRIQTYGWKPSVARLAELATFILRPGVTEDDIRTRTVDPLLSLTGDSRATRTLTRMHRFVSANRDRIRIVHEEAISYLQHLVLVEGNDTNEGPSDTELTLWILAINCHLGKWAEPDSRQLTTDEELIAITVRARCFN